MRELKRWLTVQEVATAVALSDELVLAAIRTGALLASNVGQGKQRPRWRIAESDLAQWLADRQSVPARRTGRRRTVEIPQYV